MKDRCREIRELIPEFVTGSLATDKMIAVSHHVGQCILCREYLLGFEADDKTLCAFAEAMESSVERVEEQVLDALSRRRLAKVLGSLSVFRTVATNKFVKVVAVAVIAVAAGIGIALLLSRPVEKKEQVVVKKIERQPGETAAPAAVEQADIVRAKLEAELKQMEQMFAAGDVDGLVAMLSEASLFGKVFAANYLARIGDLRAVAALEKAEDQYYWPDEDNPFAAAIDEIKSRAQKEKSTVAAVEQEPVRVKPSKDKFASVGMLSGLIMDAQTAEAVSDAEVKISKGRIYRAVTDANGFYHFDKLEEAGSYRIEIRSKDYVGITDYRKIPMVALGPDSQVVKHFELQKACMIDIQVVDEQGEPIEDVQLTASSLTQEYGRDIGQSERTDEEGMATLGGFEPSDSPYLITAIYLKSVGTEMPGLFRLVPADYAPSKLLVTLNDPKVIEYGEIVMQKGVSVQGFAQYADGVPAAGLKISAYPQWWHSTTCPRGYPIDEVGSFTLKHIVPGTYRLQVGIPTGRDMWMGLPILQTDLPLEDGLLMVTIPRKSPGALVSISGTIRFVGGETPDYVEVSAYSRQSGHHHVNLGRGQDTFMVDSLEPGPHRVTFRGHNVEEKVIEDVSAPSSGLEVELRYAAKQILSGVVVRADTGEPVRRFKAHARKLKTLRGSNYVQSDRWSEFAGAAGEFEIEAVGAGIYQVQVAAEGFAWVWSEEINTDENEPVVVKLAAGGAIKGRVVNESGQPVSGAKVIPLSKAGGTTLRVKDAFVSEEGAVQTVDGQFLLENLAAGKESIKVTHPDYSFAVVKDIEVVQGRRTEDIEVVLTKGGTVEGYVYDVQGKPQANVTLYFQDGSGYGGSGDELAGRLATVVTDSNGFYRAKGLPERMCYVRRMDSWKSVGVVRRALVPANGKTVQLNFGGRPTIGGQVVIDDQSLANNRVLLGDVGGAHFGVFRCCVMTDADGRFSFAGAPPGRYAVYYDNPHKRGDWRKIVTIDVGQEDMDLGPVPKQMGRVVISISAADPNERLADEQVYLQEGDNIWGAKAGDVSKPQREGEPYVVRNVLPGRYTVVLRRSDNVMMREAIELETGQDELNVSLQIPKSTAIVRGQCVGDAARGLVIWSEDKKVMAYLNPDESGAYEIRNLPARDYSIGGNLMVSGGEYVRFSLSQGQNKTLDIDTLGWALPELSSLHTQVVGENGVPLTGAQVWLERAAEVVEPLTKSGEGQYFVTEPGEYTLHAVSTGYKEARKTVWLEAKDTTETRKEDSVMLIRLEKR